MAEKSIKPVKPLKKPALKKKKPAQSPAISQSSKTSAAPKKRKIKKRISDGYIAIIFTGILLIICGVISFAVIKSHSNINKVIKEQPQTPEVSTKPELPQPISGLPAEKPVETAVIKELLCRKPFSPKRELMFI